MTDTQAEFISIADLRIGLFVYLDLGWLSHPFPLSSFKLQSEEHIAIIRGLGIERIRYSPERSDPAQDTSGTMEMPTALISPKETERQRRTALLGDQNASLKACEHQYSQASKRYKQLLDQAKSAPDKSRAESHALIDGMKTQLLGLEESSIRLLSEQTGDRASLHSINVAVLSLLLGKACGLGEGDLQELGVGALLHDMGTQDLPSRLRWDDEQFSSAERKLYQEHVGHGIVLGKKMALSSAALLCIAQHHESACGSG